jgi:hypothetical protein
MSKKYKTSKQFEVFQKILTEFELIYNLSPKLTKSQIKKIKNRIENLNLTQ